MDILCVEWFHVWKVLSSTYAVQLHMHTYFHSDSLKCTKTMSDRSKANGYIILIGLLGCIIRSSRKLGLLFSRPRYSIHSSKEHCLYLNSKGWCLLWRHAYWKVAATAMKPRPLWSCWKRRPPLLCAALTPPTADYCAYRSRRSRRSSRSRT